MIEIEAVGRVFGDTVAVDDVSLTVEAGEVAAIVGTSGSGKTTLLRMINRLVEPSRGRIRVNGADAAAIPAHLLRRGIGYAIQGNGLFPHRSVAENIATVPELLGWDRARISARVDELLGQFGLDPARFRDRRPHELSGGEQQRVGVARALAAAPPILLMDEPFGALDPIIRDRAREDLRAIQRTSGTTIVLVTHDMDEAMGLATRIAVMDRGRLLQYAPPAEILAAPADAFVAEIAGIGDRALRLLGLRQVRDILEPGDAAGPPVPADLSLRAALAECLWSGRAVLPVADGDRPLGRVTRSAIERAGGRPQ